MREKRTLCVGLLEILRVEGLAGIQRSEQISSGVQRLGSDEDNPNENDTEPQNHRRRVLCLRRMLPEGISHKCQWLQLP